MNPTSQAHEAVPVLRAGRGALLGLFALVVACAVATAAFVSDAPQRGYHAYLAGYAFVLSIVLGCMTFVMIAHAANTTWPVAVRRLPEALGAAMPVLALLFVPVVLGARFLYPWAHAQDYAEPIRHLLEHRRAFMNETWFTVRAFAYLLVWSVIAVLLRQWSFALDRPGQSERYARRLRRLSYAGLPISALTTGFAAYEWFMALSPDFVSTMFSALWIAMCLHAGIASTVLLVALAQRSLHGLNASHAYALGRLLFAFLIFLGYTAFFQFLLVWMANRPSEAAWYLERWHGAYRVQAYFLMIGEFALPFFVLLSYRLKRSFRSLAPVALWCLGSLYVHVNWLITPAAGRAGNVWLDLVAMLSVLTVTAWVALVWQRGRPLSPVNDPRYAASLTYTSR